MHVPVRTAIIPAAGMGTRLLPLTHAVPKELLPVWKRPVLDYAVEEALQAGIKRLVVVIAPGKEALRRHFAARGGFPQLEIAFVEQREAEGLGDAVRRAAPRGEPVAVLLPDEVLVGGNCLRQLLACRARVGGSAVAVQKVACAEVGRYGIVDVGAALGPELRIQAMIEKPHPDSAPSDLAIIGRYVLDSTVIDALQHARPTVKGEVQLTDSIAMTCAGAGVSAVKYHGHRFDCGSFEGLLQANVALAAQDQDAANEPGTRAGIGREANVA